MHNYFNIYNSIISLTDYEKLTSIDVNQILLCTQEEVILLISNLTNLVINNNSYKFNNYTNLFSLMVNYICTFNKNKNCILPFDILFLEKLSILNKGQIYLEQLKKYIKNQISKIPVYEILISVCKKGTLPIYFFWKRLLTSITDKQLQELFGYSCINNDMRIFKQILKDENIYSLSDIIFINIFDTRNSFKKQKKILKLINEKIPLKYYINNLLDSTDMSIYKIKTLCKYYHTEETNIGFSQILNMINKNIVLQNIFDGENINLVQIEDNIYKLNEIYNLMLTPYEKILYIIVKNMYYCNLSTEEIKLINTKLFTKVITENRFHITLAIVNYIQDEFLINNQLVKYNCRLLL